MVYNAGTSTQAAKNRSVSHWMLGKRSIEVNLTGYFLCAREAVENDDASELAAVSSRSTPSPARWAPSTTPVILPQNSVVLV
jgi:hypothetical protein